MPNWCFNDLTVTGPADDIKKFVDASLGQTVEVWGPPAPGAKAGSEPAPAYFCFNALVPVPEDVIARGYDSIRSGNPLDGYHWCRENWGCKWDIYHEKSTPEKMGCREGCKSLEFSFDTANVPPKGWFVEAADKFPSLDFQMEYREPNCLVGGCLCGSDGWVQDLPSPREELMKEFFGEDEDDDSEQEKAADGADPAFHVGDKVRIAYISDCNPHNGLVGTIIWLNTYNYYPNRDYSVVEKKTQGEISYADGTTELVGDMYRKGCGIVGPVEKVFET